MEASVKKESVTTQGNGPFFSSHLGSGLMAKDIEAIIKLLSIFSELLARYCEITKEQYSTQWSAAQDASEAAKNYWNDEAYTAIGQAVGSIAQAGVSFGVAATSYKVTAGPQERMNTAEAQEATLKTHQDCLQDRAINGVPRTQVGPIKPEPNVQARIDQMVGKDGSGGTTDVPMDGATRSAIRLMKSDQAVKYQGMVDKEMEAANKNSSKASNLMQSAQQNWFMRDQLGNKAIDGGSQAHTAFRNIDKGKQKKEEQVSQALQALAQAAASTAAQQANKEYQTVDAAIQAMRTIVQSQTARV